MFFARHEISLFKTQGKSVVIKILWVQVLQERILDPFKVVFAVAQICIIFVFIFIYCSWLVVYQSFCGGFIPDETNPPAVSKNYDCHQKHEKNDQEEDEE